MQTVRFRTRMDAVQAPIVSVIGGLIREVPGTISLGQGVVHYGPPDAAMSKRRSLSSITSSTSSASGKTATVAG